MQNDPFNELLREHAGRYNIQPTADSFGEVMKKRNRKRRKRALLFFVPALLTVVAAVALFLSQPLTKPADQRISALAEKKESTKQPAVNNTPKQVTDAEQAPAPAEMPVKKAPQQPVTGQQQHTNNVAPLPQLHTDKDQDAMQTHEQGLTITTVTGKVKTQMKGREKTRESNVSSTTIPDLAMSEQIQQQKTGEEEVVKPAEALTNDLAGSTQTIARQEEQAIETAPAKPEQEIALAKVDTQTKPVQVAQSDPQPVPEKGASKVPYKHRWVIGASFTPQLINSVYSANSQSDLSWFREYMDNRQRNDRASFSYHTGIKAEYELMGHFSISTGIGVSVIRFEELRESQVSSTGLKTAVTNVQPGTQAIVYDRNRFDISYTLLETPLLINYNIYRKHVSYQLSTGMSYAYLVSTRSLVFDQQDTAKIKETDDAGNIRLQRHYLMLQGGASIAYHLGEHWRIYAGPVFRYSLNSLYSKDYVIRQNPYFIGLETGLKFSF